MDLLTIIEAAQLSGKSIQTIRRMIKQKKVRVKRQKTPQGFNYLILKDSLLEGSQKGTQTTNPSELHVIDEAREHRPIENNEVSEDEMDIQDDMNDNMEAIQKFRDEVDRFNMTIQKLLEQSERDKENFFSLIKTFQDRVFILENQIKLLEAPKPRWWQVWK